MCGGRGCVEAIARGPALAAWAQAQGWRPGQPDVTAKDLAGYEQVQIHLFQVLPEETAKKKTFEFTPEEVREFR